MLKAINPTVLRTSLLDTAAPTHGAPADPAGFSSLLRQQTTSPPPAAAPAPQPPAPAAAKPPQHEASATREAAAKPAAQPSRAEAAPADAEPDAQAADAAEPPVAGRAPSAKTKARDGTPRAAVRHARAETAAADAAAAPPSAAAPSNTAPATTSDAATPPALADWLAALQARQPRAESNGRGDTPTDAATDSAVDADAAGEARHARTPLEAGAADNSGTAAHAARTTERAEAALPAFAAALAEQRQPAHEPGARVDAATSTTPIGATGLGAAPTASAIRDAAPVTVALPTPVNAPDFAQTLGVQLSVFAKDGVQQAELHLNPADMGPVSVQIVMDGTQARIDFGADVAATRQAIEAGLPELASALRDAGFTLAGGGVSQHAGSRRQDDGGASPQGGSRRALPAASEDSVTRVGQAARRLVSRGGVDLYA